MSDQIKTLRDEFAMEWMKGVLASPRQTTTDRESFAECAYRMADAMMEARQKKAEKIQTERQALQDNLKPEFVVVPRVATAEMVKAGYKALHRAKIDEVEVDENTDPGWKRIDAINAWRRVTSEFSLPWGASASRVIEAINAIKAERDALRAALQGLVSDLDDYPAVARLLDTYEYARAALGEKE